MDNRKELIEKILDELNGRSGFDDWWCNIDEDTQEEITETLVNILPIHGVVKPLNFNINKDLKIKSLGDLKRAYPDNHSHRVSSFGGCINYFVDGQLVYERKI